MNYDIIGDVHGQSEKFEALLNKIGYVAVGSGYRAPQDHRLVLLGDLIDRGPGQIRVLEIVRSMVESGDALCIMGNHEFNAIAYVTDDPYHPGEALRPNRGDSDKCQKNRAQHAEFLAQVGEGSDAHRDWVQWFRSLPPFLELEGIRVVHGCWDQASVDVLREYVWDAGRLLDDELLVEVANRKTPLKRARQLLLCGLEIPLAEGQYIVDKSGHRHSDVRVANWRHWCPKGKRSCWPIWTGLLVWCSAPLKDRRFLWVTTGSVGIQSSRVLSSRVWTGRLRQVVHRWPTAGAVKTS